MSWWWEADPDDVADEDSLPSISPGGLDGPPWWEDVWHYEDDSPEWERAERGRRSERRRCKTCSRYCRLDPMRRCSRCRVRLGYCSWCGLNHEVYRDAHACRTCYRWLLRNRAISTLPEAAERLLLAAERRYQRTNSAGRAHNE